MHFQQFSALPNAIKQLEGRSLSLLDSMGVIDKVCKKLETAEGELGSAAQSKMTTVLKKNPGFKSLQAINVAITSTEGSSPLEVDVAFVRFYRYSDHIRRGREKFLYAAGCVR